MNTISFESSQYVPVEFTLANAGQRLLAAFIDMLLFLIYFIVVLSIIGGSFFLYSNTKAEYLTLLLIKLPWLTYNPLCEYYLNGQTLGKYIVGIRVVTQNGERLKLKEVFARWIFKGDFFWITANIFILLWFVMGFLALFFISLSKWNQRVADVVADTVVINLKATKKVSIKDLNNLQESFNEEISYPQVVRFTDEDMMLIKKTILRLKEHPSPEAIKFGKELCDKCTELMGISPIESKRMEFLEQVLRDYVTLTR